MNKTATRTPAASATLERVSEPPMPDEDARERLAGVLDEQALAEAVRGLSPAEITGAGGLLTQLAGRVLNAALQGELSGHLGYGPGEQSCDEQGNLRNGYTAKTVQTNIGPVRIDTPRDRAGTFQPVLIAKGQRRLEGLDARILDLYAGGMTVRDIVTHLQGLYGTTQIGRDTVSRITDQVLSDVKAWRSRPLDGIYAIVYLDALIVKIRADHSVQKHVCYLVLGVNLDGERDVLGIWWQQSEGAKFWLHVLNDLHVRGVKDVLICCVDGLTGFPEAIEAVFPRAWVQTCIVHQTRSSMKYVAYQDRKKLAADLRPIYTATDADAASDALDAFEQKWGTKYPMIGASWREKWEYITPFLSLPPDLRRSVYTTNSIEGLNRQIRKTIKTRGHFPDEDAATKLIYLAIIRAQRGWRKVFNWTSGLRALKIHFGDRIPE